MCARGNSTPDPGEAWWEPVPRLRGARYSQSLERGLAILESFTPERPARGIAEIADELGMSRSTTHRYALTLTALGYLVRAPRRQYRLGLRVTDLGLSAVGGTSLREHARPHLEELARRAPYALALAVLDGAETVHVEDIPPFRVGGRPIALPSHTGVRRPAHHSALGRLLLAHLPPREQAEALAELAPERGRGPGPRASRPALRRELAAIRAEGLARGGREAWERVCEIAAPVRNLAGEVCAGVSMAAARATISPEQLAERLGPHLVATADSISAQLGYRREDERR